MTDAQLEELLADLICAAEDATEGNEWAREARAEIVAHVREREVELMALCRCSGYCGTSPEGAQLAVRTWREFGSDPEWMAVARALRDAWDQAGGKGA